MTLDEALDCVFCPDNWANLDVVNEPRPDFAIINPLDPVTKGHVLIIAARHTQDASKDYVLAGRLMEIASAYVLGLGGDANIITSIGPAATQTVLHTHLHVVPRTEGDGLILPWTGQQAFAEGRACLDHCSEGHTYTGRCLLGER